MAEAPPFADIWPDIAAYLKPRKGEMLVLVAHSAPFDLSLLRDEVARTGVSPSVPDLPFLDTMRGLLDASGTEVDKRDLEAVAAAVGVPFTSEEHHDALADATATARIARVLLARAVANGHNDLAGLLAAASGGRTTTATSAVVPNPESDEPEDLVVPDAHLARHGEAFPARPSAADRARWTGLFAECASLRCSEIGRPGRHSRPREAPPPVHGPRGRREPQGRHGSRHGPRCARPAPRHAAGQHRRPAHRDRREPAARRR